MIQILPTNVSPQQSPGIRRFGNMECKQILNQTVALHKMSSYHKKKEIADKKFRNNMSSAKQS